MSTEPELTESENAGAGEIETSPGQFLSAQRSQRGLSQKEVADKLHITVHYVNAIESDAYEKLPGTIFAKGYMKRYAEILQIDDQEVLDRFEEFQQAQQEHEKEVTRITRRKHQARNLNLALVSVGLFAGIFAGLWFWNSSNQNPEPVVSEPVVSEPVVSESIVATDTASTNSSAQEEVEAAAPEDLPPPPAIETASPSNDSAIVDAAAEIVNEAINATSNTITNADADTDPSGTDLQPVAAIADQQAAGNESTASESVASERVITVSNEGDDVLRVSFSDESFIQVTDGNDNRLYRGVLQSGDVLEITDSAPFDILLENAPPTRLSLNGTEIDVSDSIRIDNSARLTVGL